MRNIEHQTFDQERALYGSRDLLLKNCAFDGPAAGESALKESRDIRLEDCFCNLRYPFWHDSNLSIAHSEMTPLCRAALWYSDQISITDTKLHGIKALRECSRVSLENCDIQSPEFGWSSKQVDMKNCRAESEYFLLRAEDIRLEGVQFQGKYSFQYIQNAEISHCRLDTKDAFWHARQVTVKDSVVNGEYLAWYSEGLTLIRCKITGTQPFCYCRNLTLIDCELTDADLCFEKSEVHARITTPVISIKNPLSGCIEAPAVGEIIRDDENARAEVIIRQPSHCA